MQLNTRTFGRFLVIPTPHSHDVRQVLLSKSRD